MQNDWSGLHSPKEWLIKCENMIEPTWKRLYFPTKPNSSSSGKGVGIIILDDIIAHQQHAHLKERVIKVTMDENDQVLTHYVNAHPHQSIQPQDEHGLMILHLLSHLPINKANQEHIGLLPAATFIFIPEQSPSKLEKIFNWLLTYKREWNIQIALNLAIPNVQEMGALRRTNQDIYYKAFQPLHEHHILVISANGNSKAHNQLHPKEFFTVGGYNDQGIADYYGYRPHPASVHGQNGDGDIRPDLLAPFSYLPVPFSESKSFFPRLFSYFGGSCGAATLVAGAAAYLLSSYPQLSPIDLRTRLQHSCYDLDLTPNFKVPVIHVGYVIQFLNLDVNQIPSPKHELCLASERTRHKAVSITKQIDAGTLSRNELWSHLSNESEMIKKVIISYGLNTPKTAFERELYWKHFTHSPKDSGERISWLYQLLFSSAEEELSTWIQLLTEDELEVTLCVKLYLEKHYPEAPLLYYTPDPNPFYLKLASVPIRQWADTFLANRENLS